MSGTKTYIQEKIALINYQANMEHGADCEYLAGSAESNMVHESGFKGQLARVAEALNHIMNANQSYVKAYTIALQEPSIGEEQADIAKKAVDRTKTRKSQLLKLHNDMVKNSTM